MKEPYATTYTKKTAPRVSPHASPAKPAPLRKRKSRTAMYAGSGMVLAGLACTGGFFLIAAMRNRQKPASDPVSSSGFFNATAHSSGGRHHHTPTFNAGGSTRARPLVRVAITAVHFGYVPLSPLSQHGAAKASGRLFSGGGVNSSTTRFLAVTLRITNRSARPVHYYLWSRDGRLPAATLSDRHKIYQNVFFLGSFVRGGQSRPCTIAPGAAIRDVLVFSCKPHGQKFNLTLPGAEVGQPQQLRLAFRAR